MHILDGLRLSNRGTGFFFSNLRRCCEAFVDVVSRYSLMCEHAEYVDYRAMVR